MTSRTAPEKPQPHPRSVKCLAAARWLAEKLPNVFREPFDADRLDVVDAMLRAIHDGGWEVAEAPRGIGTTSIAMGLIAMGMHEGSIVAPLVIGPRWSQASCARRWIIDVWAIERRDSPLRELARIAARGIWQPLGGHHVDFVLLDSVDSPVFRRSATDRARLAAIREHDIPALFAPNRTIRVADLRSVDGRERTPAQ